MAINTRIVSVVITLGILLLSYAPLSAADGGEQEPSSHAFLPSWSGGVSSPSTGPVTHDFDDQGNMYYAASEDYGSWMGGQYELDGRGFHILKISPEGTVEYSEKISCSNYCNQPNYYYSSVLGIHTIAEDQFYITLRAYSFTLSFDSTNYYASGNNIVTAFYNNGSWDWVEMEPTTYSPLYQSLDENNNLYTVISGSSASGWQDYSITSSSTSGTNWVRNLEIPYQSPTYNYLVPLFDVNESGIHVFLTAQNSVKYDSQTVLCPLGGENGYCHMWIAIGTTGVKQSVVSSPYTSIHFTMMKIENGDMYLTGNTLDYVSNSNTESNFTGQKISHSPRYAQYIAVMNGEGSWDGHTVVNEQSDEYELYPVLVDILTDGSVIFSDLYLPQTSIGGATINQYPNADSEFIMSKIDLTSGIEWSVSIGFGNPSIVPYGAFSDGDTAALHLTYPSNGFAMYQYQGVEISSPTGTNNSEILWVDLENGEIVDVESTTTTGISGRSNDGGVIATQYNYMYYFMPDFDGDNVGSNDNCPDTFNPDQADYNSNGDGNACDPDDDSDGVLDGFDACPTGVLSWTSGPMTDHDGDGCKDITEEDLDDDNDGKSDATDSCPLGINGADYDLDGDGCKDVEDDDDDGDQIRDESDLCSTGLIDWSSGTLTDHDGDGCKDEDFEDADDDNDGVPDSIDTCPRGAVGWPSNLNTDFDSDGCRDSFEDEDDDNDGLPNSIDDCPRSIGIVNAQGCTATQTMDGENGGSSVVYYVCPVGSVVVLDPADCPAATPGSETEPNNNSDAGDTPFYYVCPGGSDVVTSLSECSETIGGSGANITLVVDPNSNESNDYYTCPGGRAIVIEPTDCPNVSTDAIAAEGSESENGGLMLLFMGGTFSMSVIAVLVVIIRRPHVQQTDFSAIDSTAHLFKEEPKIPALEKDSPSPPPRVGVQDGFSKPSAELIGKAHEGQEWLEWPEGSGSHWYRDVGFGGDWKKYDN